MAVPKFDQLIAPTFQALKLLGGKTSIRQIENIVAELIELSENDIREIHQGNRTKLGYRIAWARDYLKSAGLIKNISRGEWKITPKGEEIESLDEDTIRKIIYDRNNYIKQQELFNEKEESEHEEVDIEDILASPFAPKDIKIVVEPKTIDHLVARLRYDEIDMNTEFQRKGNLWRQEVQSRLIESILLRLPLPPFYFDASDDNKWLIVDGLQRLWCINNFIINAERKQNPLELTGLEILTDLSDNGVTYDQLSRGLQRRILETPITTYLIQPGTPKDVKYNVFRRINTGGLSLNSMEIRHALNQGPAANFLKNLSEDSDIKSILKLQDKRMEDRELLLRAFSFINMNYLDYRTPLSSFLDHAMESISRKSEEELSDIHEGIVDAVFFQSFLFDRHLFSRSISGMPRQFKLNSALFEVWVSLIYRLDSRRREKMIERKDELINEYRLLLRDADFVRSIATSTSGKAAVITRFSKISNLINKFSI